MSEQLCPNLATVSLAELDALSRTIAAKIRRRQLEMFKAAECACDRYTCWNCQQYGRLKRGETLGVSVKPLASKERRTP